MENEANCYKVRVTFWWLRSRGSQVTRRGSLDSDYETMLTIVEHRSREYSQKTGQGSSVESFRSREWSGIAGLGFIKDRGLQGHRNHRHPATGTPLDSDSGLRLRGVDASLEQQEAKGNS